MSEQEQNVPVPETPPEPSQPVVDIGVPETPVVPELPETPVEPVSEPVFASEAPASEMPSEGSSVSHPEPPPPPSRLLEGDVSSDDRLMAALSWLAMVILQLPVLSVVILLAEGNKDRPFQRYHAIMSILFWVVGMMYEILAVIAYLILGVVTLGCGLLCLWVLFFVPHLIALYYTFQTYNGKQIEIPALSDFARKQGWV